jgi:hypothetical protein
MKCKPLFLIVVLLFLSAVSTFGQERIFFKGKVVDFVTYQPLENTCVHNLSSGYMVFCNSAGEFSISLISPRDTLAITRVGYKMEIFAINDSLLNIKGRATMKLTMKQTILRSVTIYAMKPYPLFIKDLVKSTPQEKIDIPGTEISSEERASYDVNKNNLLKNTPLASPITFLYNTFSRKAKMDRMYADLVANQDEVLRLAQKYNPEIVQRITKLEGNKLDDFMLYCSFTYYTLITSTDLEIEQMIANKFIQYKRENGL